MLERISVRRAHFDFDFRHSVYQSLMQHLNYRVAIL